MFFLNIGEFESSELIDFSPDSFCLLSNRYDKSIILFPCFFILSAAWKFGDPPEELDSSTDLSDKGRF